MIRTASATRAAGTGRIETTSGPDNRPADSQRREVRYMGTFTPWSMWASRMPCACSASSNVKEQPSITVTRSSRQYGVMS
ncbi:Uncharacterised protein [Kocuria rhizophila]|nr:Uncharacterised protein [Kocuria rhizophila]